MSSKLIFFSAPKANDSRYFFILFLLECSATWHQKYPTSSTAVSLAHRQLPFHYVPLVPIRRVGVSDECCCSPFLLSASFHNESFPSPFLLHWLPYLPPSTAGLLQVGEKSHANTHKHINPSMCTYLQCMVHNQMHN